MAFSTFESYMPRMVVELPGCAQQIIQQQMQRAAVRFCKDTGVWQTWLAAFDIVEGQTEYAIDPDEAKIHSILGLKLKSSASEDFDDLPERNSGYSSAADGRLFLSAKPSASIAGGLKLHVSLYPDWTSAGLPAWILERYAEALMAAAKHELMKMPSAPWRNVEMAGYYRDQYLQGMTGAVVERDKGLNGGGIQMQIPYFG